MQAAPSMLDRPATQQSNADNRAIVIPSCKVGSVVSRFQSARTDVTWQAEGGLAGTDLSDEAHQTGGLVGGQMVTCSSGWICYSPVLCDNLRQLDDAQGNYIIFAAQRRVQRSLRCRKCGHIPQYTNSLSVPP